MTTERFFQLDYNEIYYVFDNENIPDDLIIENDDFTDFDYSLSGDEVITTLNDLDNDNKVMKKQILFLLKFIRNHHPKDTYESIFKELERLMK